MYGGNVAVVTGGASGIGREICRYLAQRDAVVVVADVDDAAARTVAGELATSSGQGYAKQVDVGKKGEVRRLIAETLREFGRIDLLVNNAGVGVDGEFKDMSLSSWEHVVDVNVWGVVYGTHFAYHAMLEQGYGQIVNVSSLAGLLPGGLVTSYVASKHAVVGFTLGLRAEAQQYGIKVNVLCPGFLETPIHDGTPKVSDYLRSERNQRDRSRFPTAERCVAGMMKGVERNRAIIISPAWQRVFWWTNRLVPSLVPFIWRLVIRRLKTRAGVSASSEETSSSTTGHTGNRKRPRQTRRRP